MNKDFEGWLGFLSLFRMQIICVIPDKLLVLIFLCNIEEKWSQFYPQRLQVPNKNLLHMTSLHLKLQGQVWLLGVNQGLFHGRARRLKTDIQVGRKHFLFLPWLVMWAESSPRRLQLKLRHVSLN